MAPLADSCGMAGGNTFEVFNAGAYNTTVYAKQGDLGTKVSVFFCIVFCIFYILDLIDLFPYLRMTSAP